MTAELFCSVTEAWGLATACPFFPTLFLFFVHFLVAMARRDSDFSPPARLVTAHIFLSHGLGCIHPGFAECVLPREVKKNNRSESLEAALFLPSPHHKRPSPRPPAFLTEQDGHPSLLPPRGLSIKGLLLLRRIRPLRVRPLLTLMDTAW